MNLPNKLSIFRILLVPIIAFIYLFYDTNMALRLTLHGYTVSVSYTHILVLMLFMIASITDFFDGAIARKKNQITSFGKFIDPIADKLLVNTMFMLFACTGVVSIVPVFLMVWRDMIVDGLRMSASAKGKVVAAGYLGKVKTVLQMVAIIFLLLKNIPFVFFNIPVATMLLWLAVFASIGSALTYFMKVKDVIMESM